VRRRAHAFKLGEQLPVDGQKGSSPHGDVANAPGAGSASLSGAKAAPIAAYGFVGSSAVSSCCT
jgi:hypothetical protein